MKKLFIGIHVLALIACSCGAPQIHAVDGAPIELETSTLTEGYEQVSPQRLLEWGIQASAQDALDGEYAFQISLSDKLLSAIDNEAAAIHFSLLTSGGDFALGLPKIDDKVMDFWMVSGYRLRVMLEVKTNYHGLKPGVGYFSELDPREYVVEEK